MQDLSGKVAVVTGGGGGIGRALALAFADEGMDVAIADVEMGPAASVAEEVRAKGRRAITVACDVSDRNAVGQLCERVYAEFGVAHVVCNNAGVVDSRPTYEMSESDWDWVLGVDLYGVIHGVQAFLPRMVAEGGEGHIVNTASITGLVPWAAPGIISYVTAKHGVVGLSEALHDELADHGIGVTVLCPGAVQTRIGQSARNRPERFGGADAPRPATRAAPDDPPAPVPVGADMVIEPEYLAGRVIRAIRGNELYVFTHSSTLDPVERRFSELLSAYDWPALADGASPRAS